MKLTVKENSLGEAPAPTAAAPAEKEEKHHPGNGAPGRPMFPQGRMTPPGVPGLPGAGNGFSFQTRARRTPPSQQ